MNDLLNDYYIQSVKFINRIDQIKLKYQNITIQNHTLKSQCKQLQEQKNIMEMQLHKLQEILCQVNNNQQKDQNNNNQKSISTKIQEKYQQLISPTINQQRIIKQTQIQLNQSGLDQVQLFIQTLSIQNIKSLVQNVSKQKEIIDGMIRNKQKCQKIRQAKCKNLKQVKSKIKKNKNNKK